MKKISFWTAVSIVIANMVGTGVFTGIGFQLVDIKNPVSILFLWILGGVLALFGAFVYGELGSRFPRSGGEYNFLREIFYPLLGFNAGWVSVFIGFAAPVALAAMAFGKYFSGVIPILDSKTLSVSVIIFVTVFHLFTIQLGSNFQKILTLLKILLISIFVIAGLFSGSIQNLAGNYSFNSILSDFKNPAYAVSLVYVSFAYSGWNASTYLTGEIDDPQKNISRSLITGTLVVALLYFFLNFIFLYSTPAVLLSGKLEAGLISAKQIFGEAGGSVMGIMISLLLLSTISSMIFAGPRVLKTIGDDFRALSLFAKTTKNGIPVFAVLFQSIISIVMIITSTFETILVYTGFVLNLFTVLTVAGVFITRHKSVNHTFYKAKGYPFTPVIFILVNLWFLVFVLIQKPIEALFGLLTIAVGSIIYCIVKKSNYVDKN